MKENVLNCLFKQWADWFPACGKNSIRNDWVNAQWRTVMKANQVSSCMEKDTVWKLSICTVMAQTSSSGQGPRRTSVGTMMSRHFAKYHQLWTGAVYRLSHLFVSMWKSNYSDVENWLCTKTKIENHTNFLMNRSAFKVSIIFPIQNCCFTTNPKK